MYGNDYTVQTELNLVDLIAEEYPIDDANLAHYETLVAVAAINALRKSGVEVTCLPSGCLVSPATRPDGLCRFDVQVPVESVLTPVEVTVSDATQHAVHRFIQTFERGATEIVERLLAQPGERVGVNGWGETEARATADLIIIDGDDRILWQATCRRDIAGIFAAIDANPRPGPTG